MFVSSTNSMAQCSFQPFSVGGTGETDTDAQTDSISNLESTELNRKTPGSGDNQIACADDLPIEEVIVYGSATLVSFGFVQFFWSPALGGGGGGGSSIVFTQVDANKACQALGAEQRLNLINDAFVAARVLSGVMGQRGFDGNHPSGSTYSFTLPNGSTIRGIVSVPSFTVPILAEASNSCG